MNHIRLIVTMELTAPKKWKDILDSFTLGITSRMPREKEDWIANRMGFKRWFLESTEAWKGK